MDNNSLIDDLLGQLQGAPASQIAQQLGTDPATAQQAISAALPLIVGALGHHAQQPGGAGALLQALQNPGAGAQAPGGGLGEMIGSILGSLAGGQQGQSGTGGGLGGMLGSVLGSLASGGHTQTGQGGGLGGLGGMIGSVLGGGAQSNPQQGAGGILGQIFGGAQSHAQNGLGQATGLGAEKAGQLLMMLTPLVMAFLSRHAQTNNLDAGGLTAALGQAQNQTQNQGGLTGDLLGAVLGRI